MDVITIQLVLLKCMGVEKIAYDLIYFDDMDLMAQSLDPNFFPKHYYL